MALAVRGYVFQLPDTGFQALAAGVLDAGFAGHAGDDAGGFVGQNGEDVGAEDYRAAGEVAEAEHCLYLVSGWEAFAGEFYGLGEVFVPLG